MKQKWLKTPAKWRPSGFTLLEVLVAVTLLALAMAVFMQLFSRGVNNADVADHYAKAAMLAESKLATVGVESVLAEGESSGKFDDDYAWRLAVKIYATSSEPKILSNIEATALANAQTAQAASGIAGQGLQQTPVNSALANADIDTLLPVRLYEVELSVVFKTDDNRERVVTLNTMKVAAPPT